jgi:hypothetical protein
MMSEWSERANARMASNSASNCNGENEKIEQSNFNFLPVLISIFGDKLNFDLSINFCSHFRWHRQPIFFICKNYSLGQAAAKVQAAH